MKSSYDWDVPAKIVSFYNVATHHDAIGHTKYRRPPSFPYKVGKFSDKFNLTHGDVLRFGNYRDASSYIVCFGKDTGIYSFLSNPDLSGAGHLVIPEVICEHVTDARAKFADVIADCEVLNIHINSKDEYVRKHIVPGNEKWKFDLQFEEGQLTDVWLRTPEVDWQRFDPPEVGHDNLDQSLEKIKREEAQVVIQLELSGQELDYFMKRFHIRPCRQCGGFCEPPWEVVRPVLPWTWSVEVCRTRRLGALLSWQWVCRGPQVEIPDIHNTLCRMLKNIPFLYSANRGETFVVYNST